MRLHFSSVTQQLLAVILASACFAFSAFAVAIEAHAQSVRIVALGASNTAGWGVGKSAAWPARLQGLLRARGVSAAVINAGISGNTSRDLLMRLDASVPQGTRVLILDAHGFNDRRKGQMGEFKSNVSRIMKRMAARRIAVVRVPSDGTLRGYRLSDGVHLNAEGHARLAASLLPRVLAAIRK